jgi:peroxiredoxin
MAELGELGEVDAALRARGGHLYALSVDPPEEARAMREQRGFPFSILCDPELAAVRALGLEHAHGAPTGADISIPAQFLVERGGRIVWTHVATQVQDRADPVDVLAAIARL